MIPFNTLLKREVKRFMKISKETLLTPLITSLLYLLIFGVGLGEQIKEGHNVPYFVFLIPGLIMMGMLNNSFMNPSFSLLLSKVYGDIEDLKITPLTPKVIVWSISVAGLIRGLVVSIIIFIAGQIFNLLMLKQFLIPAHPLILILVLLIAGITFALIGFSAGIFVRSFEKLNIIAQFVILPLTYLGGVFFSLNNLHPFWQLCSKFNPIFYYINATRYGFLNISDASFLNTSLITILFFIIAYSVALLSAKKASYKHL